MDRDGVIPLTVVLVFPDTMEQFLRADYSTYVFKQHLQNLKLSGRKDYLFFVQVALVRFDVQRNTAMGDYILPFPGGGLVVPFTTSDLRFDAGYQFQRPEKAW